MSTTTRQINLKMPANLYDSAEAFAATYGYRNVQELAMDSLREKIFEKSEFDESFTPQEIERVERLIAKILKEKPIPESELWKALK